MKLKLDAVLTSLLAALDNEVILTGDALIGRYSHIWKTNTSLEAKALLLPATTAEVSTICRICYEHNQPMVIQGGLTGLVGGTESQTDDIVISLQRMNRIEEIDTLCRTMTVEAGCILETIHRATDAHDLFFPLNFGAKGSAQIGGCIATNAGGLRVKRFGMTRNLILGLEVVLSDGKIINSLKKIIKNNSGYNLNQLFIGSEGTLGIITRATLKLEEKLVNRSSVFVGLAHFEDAIRLLRFCDSKFSGLLSAFEILWANTFSVLASKYKSIFEEKHNYYVLLEVLDNHSHLFKDLVYSVFEEAIEKNLIQDAVFANSAQEHELFWSIREDVEVLNTLSKYQQHFDVSVPIDQMAGYVKQVNRELAKLESIEHVFCFGHLADGNLHFIIGKNTAEESLKSLVNEIIYAPLRAINGSISAEHGIGMEKKQWLSLSRTEEEIELIKKIKVVLDPKRLLNAGKIID
jgi:FAD/FMN-containing dehydrogenase